MFMGEYQNSIDAKNRMIIPSKHRESLGLHCVLTKGIDRCMYIYSVPEWEEFTKKLTSLPDYDGISRKNKRDLGKISEFCEIDKQGRIVVPQKLREYAGIERELVTVGVFDKIEVWSKEEWERTENGEQPDPGEIAKKMMEYGV
ncbi:MAG: division/cell wall cluster transcriptional repressor MraZ [Clostridiales bacterium]|nr:division/cell wall cluster transcriptional repressor MraZ [Clostridiales bacterium]